MSGASSPSQVSMISKGWSCDTLLRGCSFLAEQQAVNGKMTTEELIAVPSAVLCPQYMKVIPMLVAWQACTLYMHVCENDTLRLLESACLR